MYKSTKVTEKFSVCFRQHRADGHCSFLHGYDIYFKFVFRANNLDDRNWVQDFGFMSRTDFKFDGMKLKEWFKYMFDHTTIVAADDPLRDLFSLMNNENLIQLRILEAVGCERLAELVFSVITLCLKHQKNREVELESVECFENEINSAIYVNNKFC